MRNLLQAGKLLLLDLASTILFSSFISSHTTSRSPLVLGLRLASHRSACSLRAGNRSRQWSG